MKRVLWLLPVLLFLCVAPVYAQAPTPAPVGGQTQQVIDAAVNAVVIAQQNQVGAYFVLMAALIVVILLLVWKRQTPENSVIVTLSQLLIKNDKRLDENQARIDRQETADSEFKRQWLSALEALNENKRVSNALLDSQTNTLEKLSVRVSANQANIAKFTHEGSEPVQRINENVSVLMEEIELIKDIGTALADMSNTNQEALLRALENHEARLMDAFNKAISEMKAAIEKRKTDSQPIVAPIVEDDAA